MRVTKKISLQAHARRRAAERYGVSLTKKMRRQIVAQIRNGKARFLGRQSNRVTGWEVIVDFGVDDEQLKVLYDSKRKCLVTVLPQGVRWKYEDALHTTTVGS